MPNYVRTRLVFKGEKSEIKRLQEFVTSTYEKEDYDGNKVLNSSGNVIICTNHFDFNNIVPMPDELNIESGTCGEMGMRFLNLINTPYSEWTDDDIKFFKKTKNSDIEHFKKCIEIGFKYIKNIKKYGYKDWYDFHIRYWGTKWNAIGASWDGNSVYFETAWSFAAPIVEKLSTMFPTVTIEFAYADENASSNTGKGEIKNGECIREYYPDCGSNDGYALYKELWNDDSLHYDPEKDTYVWDAVIF